MVTPLKVEKFALAELTTFHANPRRGSIEAIAASLTRRGLYRPIVVNRGSLTGRPMEILAGNHTFLAARSLGWDSIEATTVDVDDDEAAQIVLADNRLADLATYDDDALLEVMQSVTDLTATGYAPADLEELLALAENRAALTDPDDAPPLPEHPLCELGDLFELGPNRLVVGSATDYRAVSAALPTGAVIDCVWTDPPYGVAYSGAAGTIQGDEDAATAAALLAGAIDTAVRVSRPGAAMYIAHSDLLRMPLQEALTAAGCTVRQTLIWVKDRLVLGRSDYHYRHEPILEATAPELEYSPIAYGFAPGGSGRKGRGGDHWFGDASQTTVFEEPRPSKSSLHPTMKPVALIERMVRNSCRPGHWVLDLFAGSGSTLIAAYAIGARALLVEIDPRFADVICRRWQEHTGVVPVRSGVEVDFCGVGSGREGPASS